MLDSSITKRRASVPNLRQPAMGKLWRQLFKKGPPPETRKDLMLRLIGHRLQEQEFGGLSDAGYRRLRQLATTSQADPDTVVSNRPPIKPGTSLVRRWKEQVHVVEVEAQGYEYRGAGYENLSEIAGLITGTAGWDHRYSVSKLNNPTHPRRSNDHGIEGH